MARFYPVGIIGRCPPAPQSAAHRPGFKSSLLINTDFIIGRFEAGDELLVEFGAERNFAVFAALALADTNHLGHEEASWVQEARRRTFLLSFPTRESRWLNRHLRQNPVFLTQPSRRTRAQTKDFDAGPFASRISHFPHARLLHQGGGVDSMDLGPNARGAAWIVVAKWRRKSGNKYGNRTR